MIRILTFILTLIIFSVSVSASSVHVTGEALLYNRIEKNMSTNSSDYNLWTFNAGYENAYINLMISDSADINGFVSVNFNTDNSFYSLPVFQAHIIYKNSFTLFYKDRILDFDDGLRILKSDSLYQPVIFSGIPLDKKAEWGYHSGGFFFNKTFGQIEEKIAVSSPSDFNKQQYSLINRTIYHYNAWQISGNLLYQQQEFNLPEVNSSSWAQIDGVWYEFNTNSFYQSEHPDYSLTASGEIQFAADNFIVWGEAGLDKKSGGGRFESVMKASDAGNTADDSVWQSFERNLFIAGAGLQWHYADFLLEPEYRLKAGRETQYENAWKTNTPFYNEFVLKGRVAGDFFELTAQLWYGMTKTDVIGNILFDEYNFGSFFQSLYCSRYAGIKSYNTFSAGSFDITSDMEFRLYDTDQRNISSFEGNIGVSGHWIKKIDTFCNVRYKFYSFEKKYHFFDIFAEIKYNVNRNTDFALDYGLDPRLKYDKDYGFEYELIRTVQSVQSSDFSESAVTAEKILADNYFITLRADLRF